MKQPRFTEEEICILVYALGVYTGMVHGTLRLRADLERHVVVMLALKTKIESLETVETPPDPEASLHE